jgi:hypothetical protein
MKVTMRDFPRFKNEQARNLLRLTLAMDPTMTDMLRRMLRMGAHNIRPDYMLIRKGDTYEQVDDPGCWIARLTPYIGVMLLRGKDGVWFLNGF